MAETRRTGAPDDSPPRRRWERWLLTLSLAFNFAVIGVLIGAFVSHGGRPPVPPAPVAFGPFSDALDRDDRRALFRAFVEEAGPPRSLRMRADREFADMIATLRAEPFDAAALEEQLGRQRQMGRELSERGERLLVGRVEQMNPRERAAFADRLVERRAAQRDSAPRESDGAGPRGAKP